MTEELPMGDKFPELNQAIRDKNLAKAHQMLDAMMLKEPEFNKYSDIQIHIMLLSIESQAPKCLLLLKHPFCHGDWYQNEHYNAGQNYLADILCEKKAFDFIEPCLLQGLTSMEMITSSLIKSNSKEGIDYILNHPHLDFDYGALKTQYAMTFISSDNLDSAKQIHERIYHTPKLIYQCIEKSISFYNIKGLKYLFEHEPIPTQQVMSYFFESIESDKKNVNYTFRAISQLAFKEQMSQYLPELYTTLKEHIGFTNSDKITQYFLEPYFKNANQLDNLFGSVYQFLNTIYENEPIPMSIMQSILANKQNSFKDFDIFYEKRKLEESTLLITNTNKSLKL